MSLTRRVRRAQPRITAIRSHSSMGGSVIEYRGQGTPQPWLVAQTVRRMLEVMIRMVGGPVEAQSAPPVASVQTDAPLTRKSVRWWAWLWRWWRRKAP